MVDADNKLFIEILKMLRTACSSKMECESCPIYDKNNVDCLLAVGKLGGHPAFWDIEKLEDKEC